MPVEAVMLWNEPNNLSHWDFEVDREWRVFSAMARLAGQAVRSESQVTRVLGGISPIDPAFITRMAEQGGLDEVDVVAVHGFPLDWNHWQLDEWPDKLAEIRAATSLPVWITEVGVSTFGAEEVQEFGLRRTAELLLGAGVPRIHWYSLFDLPRAWPATTRHREAEGSSYYRHFYMGLLREDGAPKRALRHLVDYTPELGLCQWFHFEDHRLADAVNWLKKLGVKRLRTGLSWSDSLRPGAEAWFDRQMQALEPFDVTLTYCYTPESRGVKPNHTSPPQVPEEFADFCAAMTRRYVK